MNKFNLTALSAAFCLATSTGALAGAMSKADYNTAKVDIASSYKSDAAVCAAMAGNAKDICVLEAKGREKVALAQLVAKDSPSDRHRYDVRIAKADAKLAEKTADANATAREKTTEARKDAAADKRDADYAVAKEKCDAYAGDVKATCVKDAKARYGQS